jgi:small subunit ribosomal protein S17
MKRRHTGVVVKNGSAKTLRVDVEKVYRHRRYGKTLRRTISCQVHDEGERCVVGDVVEIVESRPLSRTKRWALIEIVTA